MTSVIPRAHCHLIAQSPESRDPCAQGACILESGTTTSDSFAPFAYDAVYAIARAADQTLRSGASPAGAVLMSALLNTTFSGASGSVSFDENGDRYTGISYDVYNMAGQGMVNLGKWRQGATWAERFAQELPAASYVAVDGSSKAPELSSSALLLPLGVLCEDSDSPKKTPREACDHIKHAVEALNDKNDGWYDELLPNHTIVTAVRSVGCGVEGLTRSAWLELQASLPGFTAVIGPGCSGDVWDVAGREWRASDGGHAVVISPSSTAPTLSDESAYPNVARMIANDTQGSAAITALCVALGWDRVALIHDSTTWSAGGAAAFQAAFEAGGGEILPGGQISFTLAEFDSGAVHARELLEQLKDQEAKVIVMIVQPYIQRALFAWSFDHETLYGPGYGWVSFWPGEAALHNPDGSVNTSALQGAEGLISLHPTFDTS